MRFILGANGFSDIPLVPDFVENGIEAAVTNTLNNIILNWVHIAGVWIAHSGLPIVTEGLLVWSLFCFLMAITGKAGWMERGVKSILGFTLLGVVSHAL